MSLSSDFELLPGKLHDAPIGAKHHVHAAGEHILVALGHGALYQQLLHLAKHNNISQHQLHELLGFLNIIGALQRHRPWRVQPPAAITQCLHLLIGVRYAGMSWRCGASWHSVTMAIIRASWPVILATLLVCSFAAAAGLFGAGTVFGMGLLALLVFVASLTAHETVHIFCIQKQHVTAAVLQRGMRLGIIHAPLAPHAELLTAIAGPAAGIGSCLTAAVVCMGLSHLMPALVCLVVGSFHMGSLLPWYSDGATVLKMLQRGRYARSK